MATILDNFIITGVDESGNVTLQLSDYAAWALLRRLQGEPAADVTEKEFVKAVAYQLEQAIQG